MQAYQEEQPVAAASMPNVDEGCASDSLSILSTDTKVTSSVASTNTCKSFPMGNESDDEDDWEPSDTGSGNEFEAQPKLAASAPASHSRDQVSEVTAAHLYQLKIVCVIKNVLGVFIPKHAAVYLYCHWTACPVLHMLANGHQLLATGAQTSIQTH